MYISKIARYFILIRLLFKNIEYVNGSSASSFFLSFQRSRNVTTNEWAEYKGDMPVLKEFSVCHWDRVKYFNDQINTIWSYCFKTKQIELIDCFQLHISLIHSTANRHVRIDAHIFNNIGNTVLSADIIPYGHRKWHHYCWLYSSITGKNRIYWNGNILVNQTIPKEYRAVWKGNQNGTDSAFVIGQEQDKIRGGYQLSQLFSGDVAELNVWDHHVNENIIRSMAHCKTFPKGNIKSWDLQNLKINKASVISISDTLMFCENEWRLIIFPKRQPLYVAKRICTIHGGKIVTPYSDKENEAIMNLVKQHHQNCIDTQFTEKRNWGKLVWLGLKRVKSIWYDVKGDDIIKPINYSRWLTPYYLDNVDCAYLQTDGTWYYGFTGHCPYENLCTICSVTNTPVFTLKGQCSSSNIDYNYYMNTDSKHEIYNFEGYKNYNISNEPGQMWLSKGSDFNIHLILDNITAVPIGRLQWNVYDKSCGDMQTKYVTFSQCEFGKEFTCDSGHCIDVQKKCDYHADCDDNSDEKQCSHIRIPHSYKKLEAPSSNIHAHITIQSIHEINTVEMVVELTSLVSMKWYDGRLTFTNLDNSTKNLISIEEAKKIWTPLDHVIHDSALIGKIFLDQKHLSIEARSSPKNMDAADAYEDRLFDGDENMIEAKQREMRQ